MGFVVGWSESRELWIVGRSAVVDYEVSRVTEGRL